MQSGSSVSSLEEASAYLARAHADGRTVRIGTDLETDGLDRILEHEAGDLTCTVEADTPLAELQRHVAARGQMLALDPPGAGVTVGEHERDAENEVPWRTESMAKRPREAGGETGTDRRVAGRIQ